MKNFIKIYFFYIILFSSAYAMEIKEGSGKNEFRCSLIISNNIRTILTVKEAPCDVDEKTGFTPEKIE
jgi:hypothetical protein